MILPVCAVESLIVATDPEYAWSTEELEGASIRVYNHVFDGLTRDEVHSMSPAELMDRFYLAFKDYFSVTPARTAIFERLWAEFSAKDENGDHVCPDNFKRLTFSYHRQVVMMQMDSKMRK